MYQTIDEVLKEVSVEQQEDLEKAQEVIHAKAEEFMRSNLFTQLVAMAEVMALIQSPTNSYLNLGIYMFEVGRRWGRAEVVNETLKGLEKL